MKVWNWSLVMCCEPTTTTSLELRDAVVVPPQPAARSARDANASRRSRLMEKAPFAAVSSRCLARGQYSIDQSQRLWEAVLAQAHLAIRCRVDGGVDTAAEIAQLRRAEHHLPDARLAAAEDEVVGADACELQLCLLDQKEVFDGLRQR